MWYCSEKEFTLAAAQYTIEGLGLKERKAKQREQGRGYSFTTPSTTHSSWKWRSIYQNLKPVTVALSVVASSSFHFIRTTTLNNARYCTQPIKANLSQLDPFFLVSSVSSFQNPESVQAMYPSQQSTKEAIIDGTRRYGARNSRKSMSWRKT